MANRYNNIQATNQQNADLAKLLWFKGLTNEQVIPYLKQTSYIIKGVRYSASSVAQGVLMLQEINGAIKAGKLKANKTKGLHK